jgi:uncharacterized protein (TIGR03435 family)
MAKFTAFLFTVLGAIPLAAQPTTPGRLEFDVASIKLNKAGLPPNGPAPNSIFPLGPGDVFVPSGGFFNAVNQTLFTYLRFAYKELYFQTQYLLPQLPEWVRTERYDIQARVQGNPSKDDMRMMMQALLIDRCKLKLHHETREIPVFALVLDKSGQLGRQIEPHVDDPPCATSIEKPASYRQLQATTARGYPIPCGGMQILQPTGIGIARQGARNMPIAFLAKQLVGLGNFGRPGVDRTGLTGNFDFFIEWTPHYDGPLPQGVEEAPGPSFQEAMKQQLGLKMEPQKAPVEILIIDHIERPSDN